MLSIEFIIYIIFYIGALLNILTIYNYKIYDVVLYLRVLKGFFK